MAGLILFIMNVLHRIQLARIAIQKNVQRNFKKLLTSNPDFDIFALHTEQLKTKLTKMRTKTLLLSAALIAAGALSSMAQNVYSLNVVGYVTVTIPANSSPSLSGYTMVANPFDDGAGNLLNNVLAGQPAGPGPYTNFPDTLELLLWSTNTGSYGDTCEFFQSASWFDSTTGDYPPTNTIAPGIGFWVVTPPSTPSFTMTFVGNVQQGSETIPLGPAFTLAGSPFPVAIPVGAAGITAGPNDPTAPTLDIYAADGDTVYLYNDSNVPGGYDTPIYIGNNNALAQPVYGWFDPAAPDGAGPTAGPTISPGQAFFYFRGTETANPDGTAEPTIVTVPWTVSFTVQ